MRAGLSTIQQTLTPEAASVLNHSIAEAGRRNHGQTTPLHVAATLLAAPTGFLRQACIRSHPNSSHPLQCRALELCFSVALERLPTAQSGSPGLEPPISNALMAALKRAQAHQRRGCPEQQQQPLLAVKVELEQLVISILDDPSVSRVMREASFSSPAVKATIEQSLNSQPVNPTSNIGLGFRSSTSATTSTIPRNVYANPRLQPGNQRGDEVKKVIEILLRNKKKNPVLVGDSEPELVIRELLRRIEKKELGEGVLKNIEVIPLEKELNSDRNRIPIKLKELGSFIENRVEGLNGCGGIMLNFGDLKWLVDQQVSSENGRAAMVEMGKLLAKFGEVSNGGRVWLIGTATCETYLRCQVYHPSMENDWDLQAVPIASRSPLPGLFSRMGSNGNGILGNPVESHGPLNILSTTPIPRRLSENSDPARRTTCCPQCSENCEQELAKLVANDFEKSSEIKPEAASRPALPQWLQNATMSHSGEAKTTEQPQNKDPDALRKQILQELRKKWNTTCMNIHPNFHHSLTSEKIVPTPLSMSSLYNSNFLSRQTYQPKVQMPRILAETLTPSPNPVPSSPSVAPPTSPVRTELVLGTHNERIKDFFGCIPSDPHPNLAEPHSDIDSFKKLLKGLIEKVWWQNEAASAVASALTRCKMGNGRRRGIGSKGDIWLLFAGQDRVGKKKMANAISELVFGSNPIIIGLGTRRDSEESDVSFRGKTVLDRIAEAVRRNPFSVIMLQDIDEAELLLRGNIKRAMEQGRLTDSHGREISLGNVMFILTVDRFPENFKTVENVPGFISLEEEKLTTLSSGGWQLQLSVSVKTTKRKPEWLNEDNRPVRPRKEPSSGLSFDLNEAADTEDDVADGSRNSSDLTIEHGEEHNLDNRENRENCRLVGASSVSREMLNFVDEAIVFKPVDLGPIRQSIVNSITRQFSAVVGDRHSIELDEDAVKKILGGVWLGQAGVEEWAEKALIPIFTELKTRLSASSISDEAMVVRLESDGVSGTRSGGDRLPGKIKLVVDGL